MNKRQENVFIDAEGKEMVLGKFGTSTQPEFDACLAALPELIKAARQGCSEAGNTANDILWALANEGFTPKGTDKNFNAIRTFGN
ncbi:MAG: hypothetical protein FWH12_06370 [Treponema sp.]|nr:hypothetical protein [Treponema sp.]